MRFAVDNELHLVRPVNWIARINADRKIAFKIRTVRNHDKDITAFRIFTLRM